MRSLGYSLLLCYFLLPVRGFSQDSESFKVATVAELFGIPWGMAFVSDNGLLVTERDGTLSLINVQTGEQNPLSGLPDDIHFQGQGGLLDVAISPDFKATAWVYFSYSKAVDGLGATTLARAKLNGLNLVDWQDLLITKSRTRSGAHFAGRIAFDHQDHVFMSIGDRGVRANGQDLKTHAGSIIRLELDGAIPADNPFVNDKIALPEIWSYGHRNPQGLFFNPAAQQLWSNEHGPRGGDEINLIHKGLNYGWPIISYGKEYSSPFSVGEDTHKKGMEQPLKVYTPSIAPSSLMQYSGSAFPAWAGQLFSGALKLQHLNKITFDDGLQVIDETRLLVSLNDRIRHVIEGPDGLIYLSTDSGQILKLSPKSDKKS
jgi:glucose/arabinose dehydrogenase